MDINKKLHLISLGCNKNLIDSEVMLGRLKSYALTDNANEADVLIVNTCGFIGAAKEESLRTIFSLHEQRKKDSLLVVSGCLSERYKEQLIKELPEVDIFTGVGDYDHIDDIVEERKSRFSKETYLINGEERIITGSNTHAYIKISEGCNQKCSFCAIPSFKGRLKSRGIESIAKEVENLTRQGIWDFSFISQDSSSYLRDKKIDDGLILLIDAVEKIEGVKSARILYLYPATTSNALISRIIASDIFHNYFDMPIQHIDDNMLKRMKRGADSKRIKEQLNLMRSAPNSFVRTSFIAGHPKESGEEFEHLLSFAEEFEFDRVNIFAYSDEEGTAAFDMDEKISKKILNARIKKLEKAVHESITNRLKMQIGKKVTLVIEGESGEHELLLGARKVECIGEIDGEVLINESEVSGLKTGDTVEALITELAGDRLIATVTKLI
ncbi:MAG: 30S ribosomal protein S12 methylthiotransferase RimO [Campylobacteraceae bacterium]|jgi:ribosomal protein S12 methylthiotransferase RimO|nr:30S ribosomal protein S12 methylthiotransferase RimO [Campylobacteraceae bacterium]